MTDNQPKNSWINKLIRIGQQHRRTSALIAFSAISLVSYGMGFILTTEISRNMQWVAVYAITAPILLLIRLPFFHLFKILRGRWRYVGINDIARLSGAMLVSTSAFAIIVKLSPLPRIAPIILIAEAAITTYLIAATWITYRIAFENTRLRLFNTKSPKRVLIIGAGEAGSRVARKMAKSGAGRMPIGFLDDDPSKRNIHLNGIEVLGVTKNISAVVESFNVDELIVAIPSASPETISQIIEQSETINVPIRILPPLTEMLEGKSILDRLRKIQIEDLLGRPPVTLKLPELSEDIRGETVLVTGAAGSIGSELTRQIALHNPATLIALDVAETPLYFLELEIRQKHPNLEFIPIIGDIVNERAIRRVFENYRPSRVFHAAAFKHVPMMECNATEAIRNNTIGTHRVASIAGEFKTDKFVLVSTDKAVRPSSTMGASKRLAELAVLELQEEHPQTSYSAVRFGNVLGSNGSVLPIFKNQLERDEPLTLTHPDTTRYFMTIPEAVQLILQASLLPSIRGHIAMLEMGEPIKIVDLAKNLLRLSGKPYKINKTIQFTGLRPGEKLHEELAAPDEETSDTTIPKVKIIASPTYKTLPVANRLAEWEQMLNSGQEKCVFLELGERFDGLQNGSNRIYKQELIKETQSAA